MEKSNKASTRFKSNLKIVVQQYKEPIVVGEHSLRSAALQWMYEDSLG